MAKARNKKFYDINIGAVTEKFILYVVMTLDSNYRRQLNIQIPCFLNQRFFRFIFSLIEIFSLSVQDTEIHQKVLNLNKYIFFSGTDDINIVPVKIVIAQFFF